MNDEIGDGGRVDRSAGAGSHDGGDLRDHAAGERVAKEDVGIAAEREDAFLNTRAAGVIQADDRSAVGEGEIHDLANLVGVGLGKRAAEDGEILSEDVDEAPVDVADSR